MRPPNYTSDYERAFHHTMKNKETLVPLLAARQNPSVLVAESVKSEQSMGQDIPVTASYSEEQAAVTAWQSERHGRRVGP